MDFSMPTVFKQGNNLPRNMCYVWVHLTRNRWYNNHGLGKPKFWHFFPFRVLFSKNKQKTGVILAVHLQRQLNALAHSENSVSGCKMCLLTFRVTECLSIQFYVMQTSLYSRRTMNSQSH